MAKALSALAMVYGLIIAAPAMAAPIGNIGNSALKAAPNSLVTKVHSARKAHDMLHGYGYHSVVLIDKRTNYDGQSNYLFRVCKGDRRYKIRVNWYGDIVSRRRVGWCHSSW